MYQHTFNTSIHFIIKIVSFVVAQLHLKCGYLIFSEYGKEIYYKKPAGHFGVVTHIIKRGKRTYLEEKSLTPCRRKDNSQLPERIRNMA